MLTNPYSRQSWEATADFAYLSDKNQYAAPHATAITTRPLVIFCSQDCAVDQGAASTRTHFRSAGIHMIHLPNNAPSNDVAAMTITAARSPPTISAQSPGPFHSITAPTATQSLKGNVPIIRGQGPVNTPSFHPRILLHKLSSAVAIHSA